MTINYLSLGLRIKEKREKAGLSQAELAVRTKLSAQHISNVENARTKLSLEKIVDIANALGCSLDELVCGSLKVSKTVYQNEIGAMLDNFTDIELRLLPTYLRHYCYTHRIMQKAVDEEKDLE